MLALDGVPAASSGHLRWGSGALGPVLFAHPEDFGAVESESHPGQLLAYQVESACLRQDKRAIDVLRARFENAGLSDHRWNEMEMTYPLVTATRLDALPPQNADRLLRWLIAWEREGRMCFGSHMRFALAVMAAGGATGISASSLALLDDWAIARRSDLVGALAENGSLEFEALRDAAGIGAELGQVAHELSWVAVLGICGHQDARLVSAFENFVDRSRSSWDALAWRERAHVVHCVKLWALARCAATPRCRECHGV